MHLLITVYIRAVGSQHLRMQRLNASNSFLVPARRANPWRTKHYLFVRKSAQVSSRPGQYHNHHMKQTYQNP